MHNGNQEPVLNENIWEKRYEDLSNQVALLQASFHGASSGNAHDQTVDEMDVQAIESERKPNFEQRRSSNGVRYIVDTQTRPVTVSCKHGRKIN